METPPMDAGLLRYKTFWLRLGAWLVDGTILAVLTTGLTAVAPAGLGEFFVRSFLGLTYSVWMHGRFGQTLGKMAMGVSVQDVSETARVTYWQALLRDVPVLIWVLVSLPGGVYLARRNLDPSLILQIRRLEAVSAWDAVDWTAWTASAWASAEILTLLTNRKRRALHDFLANSVVIRTSAPRGLAVVALLASAACAVSGAARYVSDQLVVALRPAQEIYEYGTFLFCRGHDREALREHLSIAQFHEDSAVYAKSLFQIEASLRRLEQYDDANGIALLAKRKELRAPEDVTTYCRPESTGVPSNAPLENLSADDSNPARCPVTSVPDSGIPSTPRTY